MKYNNTHKINTTIQKITTTIQKTKSTTITTRQLNMQEERNFCGKGENGNRQNTKDDLPQKIGEEDTFLEVAAETRWNPKALENDDSKFCYPKM
jgi:hypothetical protein